MKTRASLRVALVAALAISFSWAQNQTKPLTDADIIKMTKSGLGESTILAVIQASPANFDISPNALITMKTAGVTANVINAVVAAGTNKSNSSAVTPSASAPPAETATPAATPGSQSWPPPASAAQPTQPKSTTPTAPPASAQPTPAAPPAAGQPNPASQSAPANEPSVVMMPAGAAPGSATSQATIRLPLEKTQLTQTKTKVTSLGGLANDSVTAQAMQAGANTAATEGMIHSGSLTGGLAAGEAGGVFGSAMSRRKASVTYLWAVSGPTSPTQATSNQPRFSLNFAGWMYVSLDEFEPVIIKLTPTTPPNWRLVGASQGSEKAYSSSSVDWQAFSNFMQDPAPSQVKKIAPGVFEISASMPLEAGEYGIALRPISKTMKFSGADIARNQGNGKVLNSVWTFSIK
jgi:hypothetical protein